MFVGEVGSKASVTYVTNLYWSILIKFKFTLYFLSHTNVRALVFMLHTCACVQGGSFLSIRVRVCMLRTCVYVHVANVRLCSCCVLVRAFMLRTCVYVHVAVRVIYHIYYISYFKRL